MGSVIVMQRIMVIGVSAGVGKSTFSKRLGKLLKMEVHHLDVHFWRPNWIIAPPEIFLESQKEIVAGESWIIEGNYSATFEVRLKRADTIIYLELPLYVCLFRVVKRWFMNRGRTRDDMGAGCPEKIDWAFIKFILTTYYRRKRTMMERCERLKEEKAVIILKSKREIDGYLEKVEKRITTAS